MIDKSQQSILVIRTEKLFPDGIWEGFRLIDNPRDLFQTIKNHREYRLRGEVENDVGYQQIIPQIILMVGQKIFVHKIPQTGSDGRLHNLHPIFLGGHVEESDLSIEQAADREFSEEINYKGDIITKKFLGIVNLQDNPVNSVHIGLVWVYVGDKEEFNSTHDDGVVDGRFLNWDEADLLFDNMSYWSKAAYPTLKKLLKREKVCRLIGRNGVMGFGED